GLRRHRGSRGPHVEAVVGPRPRQQEPRDAEAGDDRGAEPQQGIGLLLRCMTRLRALLAHARPHSRLTLRSLLITLSMTPPASSVSSTSWRLTSAGFASSLR